MLHSFLEERKMRVKIDNVFSDPLPINGGSPQGTLLGNLIFIVATSELDKNVVYTPSNPTYHRVDLVPLQPPASPISSDLSLIHI